MNLIFPTAPMRNYFIWLGLDVILILLFLITQTRLFKGVKGLFILSTYNFFPMSDKRSCHFFWSLRALIQALLIVFYWKYVPYYRNMTSNSRNSYPLIFQPCLHKIYTKIKRFQCISYWTICNCSSKPTVHRTRIRLFSVL